MSASIGAGTSLAYSATLGGSYTPIAKIESLTPPKIAVAKVALETFDATLLNSLPVSDSIPGWVDPGTHALKAVFDKTVYSTLRGFVGVVKWWKIITPDGSGYVFQGYIMELGREIPLKELMTADLTIAINGGTVDAFAVTQS